MSRTMLELTPISPMRVNTFDLVCELVQLMLMTKLLIWGFSILF